MRQKILASVLNELNAMSSDISALAVMSEDGLVIASASTLPETPDEDRISAISAGILRLGNKAMEDFVGGRIDQLLIQGQIGNILMMPACPDIILTALAKPNIESGLVFSKMRRAAETIRHVLCG